jgi:ubiquinone/menaquinone biosynthesis C-methylase UbiE
MGFVNEEVKAAAELRLVDEAYSSEPWWYDIRGFFILTFAYRSTLPAQVRLFSKNMGVKHLEAAIGTGTLFEIIMKWRRLRRMPEAKIVGYDYADRMLAGAKKRFANEPEISLLRADAANLEFHDCAFDTINIANAIHCFPEIEKSLREAFRVLRPGGTLAANCLLYPKGNSILDRLARRINNWGMKKGILHSPQRQSDIQDVLKRVGFEITYERTSGNCYEFIARK